MFVVGGLGFYKGPIVQPSVCKVQLPLLMGFFTHLVGGWGHVTLEAMFKVVMEEAASGCGLKAVSAHYYGNPSADISSEVCHQTQGRL